jgi:hypothetical protein
MISASPAMPISNSKNPAGSLRAESRGSAVPRILKLLLPLAILLPFLAQGPREQLRRLFTGPQPIKLSVLFVGNSLTSANNLPTVLQQFAAGNLLPYEVTARSVTPGSARLSDHWRNGQVAAELKRNPPDVLVLQGQSTEPLYEAEDFAHYAKLFKAEADGVNATTVLFSTWARPRGDPYYLDPSSGGSPEEMQARLNAAYQSVATEVDAILAPIGMAWQRAQRDFPDIALLDGTQHPTPAGTYLTAAVLFHVLFPEAPVTSSYYAGLPKRTALALQRIAAASPLGAKTDFN